eukprot:TRINITY_DN22756_c0_g1_i1.p1 TRINITY_DN22756_c0_g1~~TRINITY_DN22756_c0_g1_i1.p1  ORF type:complete len:108 (+),score=28.26 TRINITY_DN22756_c0_g1_i1:64-387(+)
MCIRDSPVSTKSEIKLDANYLFEMDKICQEIINSIVEKQNEMFVPGMTFSFKGCSRKLKVLSQVGVIELKKTKQEFLSLTKMHPARLEEIGDTFIAFLESAFERLLT